MEYQYIATTASGQLKKGVYSSTSKEKVRAYLELQKLHVVSIQPLEKKISSSRLGAKSIGWGKSLIVDKMLLAKHLSVMLKAGLSLSDALSGAMEQISSKKMKIILNRILEQINNGQTLASGLSLYPKVFSGIFIGMVRVGESSGTLERNLNYISSELSKDYELRRKVKAAMIYPIIILSGTVILGTGLTIFILPKLVDMFNSFRLELPATTKIFLGFATFLVSYGIYALIALIGLLFLLRFLIKSSKTRPFFHKLYLKIPIFKSLIKNINLTRSCRALSILLKSGVTINESLEITAIVVENVKYREALNNAVLIIKKGRPLSEALNESLYFPGMVKKMVSVGEKTGKLEESLAYLADFYEEEVNSTTKNLSTLIEPILLVVIGVILGLLAVAIISPIYQFTGSLSR